MKESVQSFVRPKETRSDGAAMVMVIVLGMIMTLVVTVGVSAALSGSRSAKADEAWNAALSAAYAGVEEYKNRLANDSTYQKFGNPAAAFTSDTASVVSLPALSPNPAFGLGPTGSWASVPGSEGRASFRYEVDNSQYAGQGNLRIRSTGRVGTETRSIVADLKQKGFIDFLYFTDYELLDPSQSNKACEPTHDWEDDHNSKCTEIEFGAGDTIDGPVHSNDTLKLCGTFKGTVTTADNRDPNYSNECGGSSFPKGADGKRVKVATVAQIGMPATNLTMKQETRSDLDEVPKPGCLYTGPTTISMASAGTLTIRSPFTVKTQIAGDPATSGSTPEACGSIAALRSSAGATIAVPNQNLIYVQDVPSNEDDPNYWSGTPSNFDCVNATTGGWKFPKSSPVITFPRVGLNASKTEVKSTGASPPHYGCRAGDVFVEGTLRGALTIAAQNYVYVTDDIFYNSPDADILGLVGGLAVWVWNPMNSSDKPIDTTQDRTINAAILSTAHTFQVQNYSLGGYRGLLNINGAIAQTYRGSVGMGSATSTTQGYKKKYTYDKRLKTIAPPKFLAPTSTTYGVTQIGGVQSAFNADGTCAREGTGSCT